MSMEKLGEIANKLVDFCKSGNEAECLNTLYAQDAVSVEPMPMPGTDSPESVGLDAIRGKHDWWNGAFEVHSASVDGPYMHGTDRFTVIFELDATEKQSGERSQMKEVALYTVKDEKIVREEFFYSQG